MHYRSADYFQLLPVISFRRQRRNLRHFPVIAQRLLFSRKLEERRRCYRAKWNVGLCIRPRPEIFSPQPPRRARPLSILFPHTQRFCQAVSGFSLLSVAHDLHFTTASSYGADMTAESASPSKHERVKSDAVGTARRHRRIDAGPRCYGYFISRNFSISHSLD